MASRRASTGQHALEFDIWAQYKLSKGYTLLAPNFRGSTGYGRTFERANYHTWGIGDRDDCLAAADFLAAQPGIDLKRLPIFGSSYGGYLVPLGSGWSPAWHDLAETSRG